MFCLAIAALSRRYILEVDLFPRLEMAYLEEFAFDYPTYSYQSPGHVFAMVLSRR
jgi:hypothetical protein